VTIDFVADYIIAKGDKPNGEPLTQLGLQKLVYLCQGWHLALMDETLFREEIYAYELDPVVKELRVRFRFFGSDPLTTATITDAERILSAGAKRVIDSVWNRYARIPTSRLVDLTHESGSPWSQIWDHTDPEDRENLIIPLPIIREWFKAHLSEKLSPRPTRQRDLRAAFDNVLAGA
jgi:uncharacterized phage-associated protein